MKRKRFLFIAILAVFAFSPLSRAAETAFLLKQGEDHLEAWRLPQAEEIARQLLRGSPDSPAALDLSAQVAFYRGRYEEALRHLEKALALESSSERRQGMRLHVQRTHDVVKKLKRYESEHFIVYLDEERDGILAPHVLDTLEKSYHVVRRRLGYAAPEKVRVEIAPDAASFNAISTLSLRDIEETGAVGICKFYKLMTISPRALMHGYRWLDSLSHEYLHFVIVGLSDNKAPIWIHEGISRYYETLWRHGDGAPGKADYLTPANETLLARALERDRFVGFKNMEPSLIRLETVEEVQLAYAEAASAVDFVVHRKGTDGVRGLLSELAKRPTAEAIEELLGMSFTAFETEWKEFLKGQGLKETEGSRVRKFKVKGDLKEDEEAVELREIQSVVARNRTHLADRLWERGRVAAAASEYRRALQASPHSTIILNKMSRILIHMERYEEALPPLERAKALDPDHVVTYVQLGRLYRATKNHPDARVALEEAIQINPFNPTIYQLLHEVYGALGEKEKAQQARSTLDRLMGVRQ